MQDPSENCVPPWPVGKNKNEGLSTWKNGRVYFAPAWFGYRSKNGNQTTRIGFSHPMVQNLTQNQAFGPVFIPKFGIPSLISAGKGDGTHKYHAVEQDANARALSYFVDKYGGRFAHRSNGKGWDNKVNPITDYNWSQGFGSSVNQTAIKNAKMGLTAMDILGYPVAIAAFYALPAYSIMHFSWYWATATTIGSYAVGSFGMGVLY
ncbi:MAG: hypothetical protein LBL79_04960 [Prevotella sp.]|jgi:hypothetical protein|nr:hypothetical protein [Prevotella sp.]